MGYGAAGGDMERARRGGEDWTEVHSLLRASPAWCAFHLSPLAMSTVVLEV